MFGATFLKNLRDVLWCIDDHHDTIAAKVPAVPKVFAKFNGYNCPQTHKHRKRTKGNLSCSEISRLALVLQDNLQASWFKKECYSALREATEGLMGTLNSYASYLKEKNKAQKLHHQSLTPSATPSDASHLEYLPKVTNIPTSLQPIEDELQVKEPYVPVAVADFVPSDRRQRYRYVYLLSLSLTHSLTHSHTHTHTHTHSHSLRCIHCTCMHLVCKILDVYMLLLPHVTTGMSKN